MKKEIAFFDFDGTITTKDTLLEFIKFSKGTGAFYTGFALNSPYLVAYKLKLISNQLAKEKVLSYFFRQTPLDQFLATCRKFVTEELPQLIRPGALDEIRKLKEAGVTVVIVSASPEYWIAPWAEQLGVQLMGTKLIVENGILTGKIEGRNCHGKEKVRRINEKYSLAEYSSISAYGDTSGDLPMLALAGQAFYKPFRDR